MEDILSKCRIEGDCRVWVGAIDKSSGHAVGRIDGRRQKLIYHLWRTVWVLELPSRGLLENVCGNKLCMCRDHWCVAQPKGHNFSGNVLLHKFVKDLDLPGTHNENLKALCSVLERLNKNPTFRDSVVKAVTLCKGR